MTFMSFANLLKSTVKVESINRKPDSKLQSVKRDRYLLFKYFILENAASHTYVVPKRTRIFRAISHSLRNATADFHTSTTSRLSLNLSFWRSSIFNSSNSIWNFNGALWFSTVWGTEINWSCFFILWNSANRSSNCFKMNSKQQQMLLWNITLINTLLFNKRR